MSLGHVVAVSPDLIGTVDNVVARCGYAVELHGFDVTAGYIYKVDITDRVRRGAYSRLHVAARSDFLVVLVFLHDVAASQRLGLIINAGAGTECAGDDDDVRISATDLLPVRDLAGVNAFQLIGGQIVNTDILVHDRRERNDCHLVRYLAVEGFEARNVNAGVPVAGADVGDAFLDRLRSGYGAFAGSGDFNLRMQLLELLGCLKRQRQQGCRTVNRDFA
ncbi:hypothetical protein D3C71_1383620 [compost metagenome]